MIIVTGATGQLGSAIVASLVRRVPAAQVGISVRDPKKAGALEALGVRVRAGDFGEPASLLRAFDGATQVLIVSSNARASGGDTLAQHRSAIEAARSVGARRVVYTSHMGASHTSEFPAMLDHAATEDMLRESGLAWTALRNGFYAASGIALMGDAPQTGVLEAPEDGPVSWTAHADLADVAAMILAQEGRFEGATPPLTGAQALDLGGLANLASEGRQEAIVRRVLSDEDLCARMAARGAPEQAMRLVLGLYRASRRGEFAQVDPTLEQLLGRRPVSLRDLLARQ